MKDLPLHLVHRFELSMKIRGSESEKLVTLGFFVAISWEPPIKLWRLPQALCGFGDHHQGFIVDRVFHLGGKARGAFGEAVVAFGDLCAQHRSNGD